MSEKKLVTFDDYQKFCDETAFFTSSDSIESIPYLTIGLAGEVGELANWVKKIYRDSNGKPTEDDLNKVKGELGDSLWYIAMVAKKFNFSLNEVIEYNKQKLLQRAKNGTLRGSGDNR